MWYSSPSRTHNSNSTSVGAVIMGFHELEVVLIIENIFHKLRIIALIYLND